MWMQRYDAVWHGQIGHEKSDAYPENYIKQSLCTYLARSSWKQEDEIKPKQTFTVK